MTRALVLGLLIGAGVLSIGVGAFQAPPAAPSPQAIAAAAMVKVRDNLYVVTGSTPDTPTFSGGNAVVFVTATGVVVVDTKLPGWGPALLERIKSVTDKPIAMIINTHSHFDHTGSNEFFGTTVDSVVHEHTRANMARMPEFSGPKAAFLPKRTFKDGMTLGTGKDQIDLYYFGPGHTGGDAWVVFPALRAMHVGDLFPRKDLPFADLGNGGSVVHFAETISKGLAGIRNVDTIIGGHQAVTTPAAMKEYASFNRDFVAWAQRQKKAGKSVDQAAADYATPAKYAGYSVPQAAKIKTNTQAVYDGK